MKIVDCYRPKPPTAWAAAQTWHEGAPAPVQADFELQAEHRLEVRVAGLPPLSLVCTPEYLVELTLGHLFAKGLIDSTADVRLLHLNCPGTVATAVLCDERAAKKDMVCSGVAPRAPLSDAAPDTSPSADWDLSWVKALTERFCSDTPMHRKTHGAHSCFIAVDGAVVFECEDIGRHNAFDKVLGHALRRGVDLRRAKRPHPLRRHRQGRAGRHPGARERRCAHRPGRHHGARAGGDALLLGAFGVV